MQQIELSELTFNYVRDLLFAELKRRKATGKIVTEIKQKFNLAYDL